MSNLIYLPEDVEVKEAKAEQWVAANLMEELAKHYPLRDWTIVVDFEAGHVVVRSTDVSSEKGYVLHLSRTLQDLRSQMKRVGGEILERGGLSRAKQVDAEDVEYLPRDFRDEVRTLDTDAPEEVRIRAQRAASKAPG